MDRRIKVAVVINNPVAFRVPVFEQVARHPAIDLKVIFSARREPGRKSDVPAMAFAHSFLKERYKLRGDGYAVHNNPDVWRELQAFGPDVVVNNGFQPTNVFAFLYSLLFMRAHVPFTDGTAESEQHLSSKHRLLRRLFFAFSSAFVGASNGSRRLYAAYGVADDKFFQSHLCVDNSRFEAAATADAPRPHDFIFCGRLIPEKRPDFAIEVAQAAARRLGREVSLLIVGAGALEAELRARVGQVPGVRLVVHGFARQDELPALYASARLFLFPTVQDTWGVVANEACAAGLPVLVTPHAGVVGELVQHGHNGFVLDFDVEGWAREAAGLLADAQQWRLFSQRSRERVRGYTYEHAAQGLVEAAVAAAGRRRVGRLLTQGSLAMAMLVGCKS